MEVGRSERAAAADVVEVDRTLNEAERRMAWLRERSDAPSLTRFDAALRDHSSGIRREFALLLLGRMEAAEAVDETRVDPAFDRVQEAAAAAVVGHRADARATTAQARVGSILIAVAGVVLILLIIRRIERARRDASSARGLERPA